MGACGSTNDEGAQASKSIEKMMQNDFQKSEKEVKLLLLGAGESGKSTIFKQMRILFDDVHGFTQEYKEQYVDVVRANIMSNFRLLLLASEEYGPVTDANDELAKKILALTQDEDGGSADMTSLSPDLAKDLKTLWKDEGVVATWKVRSHTQVLDALEYFMGRLDDVSSEKYIPSNDDILRARIRTTGIVTETFQVDGIPFIMYDVGGQRNERKKWIHCFSDCTAIVFVVAISGYDQTLYEDNSKNRMDEAVELFEKTARNPVFSETSQILFLNKTDLFDEKITYSPFRLDSGPERRNVTYEGPDAVDTKPGSSDYKAANEAIRTFIANRFVSKAPMSDHGSSPSVYVNYTCATDTQNVDKIFAASRDIILRNSLLNF